MGQYRQPMADLSVNTTPSRLYGPKILNNSPPPSAHHAQHPPPLQIPGKQDVEYGRKGRQVRSPGPPSDL
jgi:hypothetical protein